MPGVGKPHCSPEHPTETCHPTPSPPWGPATSTLYTSWGTGVPGPSVPALAFTQPGASRWHCPLLPWDPGGGASVSWGVFGVSPTPGTSSPAESRAGVARVEFLPWLVLELHRAVGLACNQLPPELLLLK